MAMDWPGNCPPHGRNAPVSSHRAMTTIQISRSAVERRAHRWGLDSDAFADAFVVALGARADREKAAHDADHGTLVDQIRDPGDGDGDEHEDHEHHDPDDER